MEQKTLGLDLGTNSIGISLRNPALGDNLKEQLEYFSSDIFEAGVGTDKSGEFSYAAQRTTFRSARRLKLHRRRRLQATLRLLMDHNLCPLSEDSYKQWSVYNKTQNLKREYPIGDEGFNRWIKLDFNADGKPDYTSPYQLRCELATTQLDFSSPENKFKLGRALYHIAQRRGFKSSKGETIAEQEKNEKFSANSDDLEQEMKKSEMKRSKGLRELLETQGLKTIGQAFAYLESQGTRIRNNEDIQATRDLYEKEITYIFNFQKELSIESKLYKRLVSTKKGEGTIFYKNPLRSQKGLVGKCTLEPKKGRCPIGHPEFEKFRAWAFINNIRYRRTIDSEWQEPTTEMKERLYREVFTARVKADFLFSEIRKWLEKELEVQLHWDNNKSLRTINYADKQNVAGCPVTARLVKLLGTDWERFQQEGRKEHKTHSKQHPTKHTVCYSALDIWHVCFQADELEDVQSFAKDSLQWDDEKCKLLLRVWTSIPQGYAMLSLKAIRNINRMLCRGLKYSDAVMLAKVPEIAGMNENEIDTLIETFSKDLKTEVDRTKDIYIITNSLIADYKSLSFEDRFAEHNTSYCLQESDKEDIVQHIIKHFGEVTWGLMDAEEQETLMNEVEQLYQNFFSKTKRNFYDIPTYASTLRAFLCEKFPHVDEQAWAKLYHPSQIASYHPERDKNCPDSWRLGTPNIGSIRNPVALRTLNILRRKINALLDANMIDPLETRVVVETTRTLNDANMRWAINRFQKEREEQNKTIRSILEKEYTTRAISETDIDTARYILEQREEHIYRTEKTGELQHGFSFNIDAKRYKLWLEQGGICFYTGKVINLTNLFDDNAFDIEHTLPRSKSFDNSDANLTICDAHYNRYIKKNILPAHLPNFEHDQTINGTLYTAIKPRLEMWRKRVERLKVNVDFWKNRTRRAQDKDTRDYCIRQRHLWQMELNYWHEKLSHFEMEEIKEGFRNSQLVDTGIITRHATLFLKSLFKNVEVQKGSVTADFRKILGIQSVDEAKNRDKHSHHAIDATILTTIPIAAKRDRMLEIFYEIEEKKHLMTSENAERIKQELEGLKESLKREIRECHIGYNIKDVPNFIETEILINHHSKDQTLTTSHRRVRIRGKKVYTTNSQGEIVEKWSSGDCIRGQLHNESYYGAIRLPQEIETENGRKPKTKDGHFIYDEKNENITMVIRVPLRSFTAMKDVDKIIDASLREEIRTTLTKRLEEGCTFKDAIVQDFWRIDKAGQEIRKDKKGRPICPIRHVRCKVATGRGFMTYDSSLSIRKHALTSQKALVHLPNRNYKQNVYAQNNTNYLFLLYEGIKQGKLVRQSRILNLYQVSEMLKAGCSRNFEQSLWHEPLYASFIEKKIEYKLSAIIKTGTRILMWNETPDELRELSKQDLLKRLFVVKKFNHTSSDHVYLKKHLNATDEIDLELVPNKFNCLIEHRDFEIDLLGNITLKD